MTQDIKLGQKAVVDEQGYIKLEEGRGSSPDGFMFANNGGQDVAVVLLQRINGEFKPIYFGQNRVRTQEQQTITPKQKVYVRFSNDEEGAMNDRVRDQAYEVEMDGVEKEITYGDDGRWSKK